MNIENSHIHSHSICILRYRRSTSVHGIMIFGELSLFYRNNPENMESCHFFDCGTGMTYGVLRIWSGWGVSCFLPDTAWNITSSNCPFPYMFKSSLEYFRWSSWPSGQLQLFRRNPSISHRQKSLFRWNPSISLKRQRDHERHEPYLFLKYEHGTCLSKKW